MRLDLPWNRGLQEAGKLQINKNLVDSQAKTKEAGLSGMTVTWLHASRLALETETFFGLL